MDADVVPGSVTAWTVTPDDQRRLKRTMMRWRMTSAGGWMAALGGPVMFTALFLWAWSEPSADLPFGVELEMAVGVAIVLLAVVLWGRRVTVRRRVERDFPVGATLTAWATSHGLAVRTLTRLTFYPWSRLTHVEVGPVLIRFRQPHPWSMVMPTYLPAGPDERSHSVDLPAQLIGPEIRREMADRSGQVPIDAAPAGRRVVIDQGLRRNLARAWRRAQFGVVVWLLPLAYAPNVLINMTGGSYPLGIFWAVMMLLGPVVWLAVAENRVSAMYPSGATITGSVGEWLEIEGPWGSVAWHRGWLRQRQMTEHTVTYEVLQVSPDRKPPRPGSVEKSFVVVPRAFLDTPAPALSTEV